MIEHRQKRTAAIVGIQRNIKTEPLRSVTVNLLNSWSDDIDTLESQLQESRALLERAEHVIQEAGMRIERPGGGGFPPGYKWLQDYDKLKEGLCLK